MASSELANLHKLTVKELRKELEDRGLDSSGLKPALVERLEAFTSDSPTVSTSPGPKTGGAPESMGATPAAAVPDAAGISEAPLGPASTHTRIEFKPSNSAASAEATELQKRQARAKKFGTTLSAAEQKALRNERFGSAQSGSLPPPAKTASSSVPPAAQPASGDKSGILSTDTKLTEDEKQAELEKRKARAKRFELPVTSNAEEQAKKKARANGAGKPAAVKETAQLAVAGKPAAAGNKVKVVVSTEEEAKRQARALRFATGLPAPGSGTVTATGTTAEQVKKLEDRKIRFGAGKVGEAGAAAAQQASPSAQA